MRKIHINIGLIILSGSILSSGCQSVQPKAATATEVLAEFEFEISGETDHIVLPVKFNGQKYQFALDTGSTDTVFDDSFKNKLGKRFLWPKKGTGTHGKEFKVEYFHVPDAYLGPFNLKHYCGPLIAVTDLNELIPDEKRMFKGLVGMDFLLKYIVQIDFDNEKVTFFRCKKDMDLFSFLRPKKNLHPEWGEPIPLKTKLFSDLRYIRGCLLDNTSAEFLIDSGWAGQNTLRSRLFEKIHSNKTVGPKRENISPNFTLFSKLNVKVIERFSVGSFEYKEHLFLKNNESILGLPFLSRHLVTFDFPNNTMYLKRGRDFNRQLLILYFEGICKVRAEDSTVLEVDPNGPAFGRGVREEDVLTEVNGREVSSLGVVEWVEFLSQMSVQKDCEITFTFKRGGEMITVPISKRDLDADEK